MKNISKEDYIFWNHTTKKPLESYDIVYHYTTIIEMLNMNGIVLDIDEEIKCVAELPLEEQIKYSHELEKYK